MHRTRLLLVLTIVIGSLFLIHSASAQSDSPTTRPRIQQIALFKNGLGFFVCQVQIPDDTKSFSILPDGAADHHARITTDIQRLGCVQEETAFLGVRHVVEQ